MSAWDGWPFARAYLLLLALAFLVVGGQVFLMHWRAAFRSKAMYAPVVLVPVLTAGGVAAAWRRDSALAWAAVAVYAIGVAVGGVGVVLHLRGIARRVGGFTPRNLTAGPPPLLPVAFAALALTGMLAVIWEV